MLYHPPLEALNLEVADSLAGYKQKIHQLDLPLHIGGPGLLGIVAHLTAYARNPDGSYGEALPPDRVPVRQVALYALPSCAVEPGGRVRYRLLVPGLVRDVVADQDLTLAEGQSFEQFLQALPETLLLQSEALAYQRDNDRLCVRAFAEAQVRAADLAPSAFA